MRFERLRVGFLFLAMLMLGVPSWAQAHSTEIVKCGNNIKYSKAVFVEDWSLPNGLLAEAYDTNGDGKTDVVALSAIKKTQPTQSGVRVEHNIHPIFWLVDLDLDGEPDKVFVDKKGEGLCSDIVLYKDLTEPQGIGPETQDLIPKGGRTSE